ncbi:hypothetical protein [Pontibacter litorisediminis]|uniref:hypothetical protein n=1 Tax=Pontibacter litorisediminis TaxID=1846260 RepID=UPI0023EB132C|nr:hypothetical protein [Pontibacter litorisediminis]
MRKDQETDTTFVRLPKEIIDKLAKPFEHFLHTGATSSAVLLLASVFSAVTGLALLRWWPAHETRP